MVGGTYIHVLSSMGTLSASGVGEGRRTGSHSAPHAELLHSVLDNAIDLMVDQMGNSAQEERRKI